MRIERITYLLLALLIAECAAKKEEATKLEATSDNPVMTAPSQLTAGNESNFSPDLSSDGKNVVFTSDKKVNKDIWLKKSSGGYAHPLTLHSADDFSPVLNPKGDKVAFISRRLDAAGNVHILKMGFSFSNISGNGEGPIEVVDLPNTEDMNPSWFPDGKKLVFAARKFSDAIPDLMTVSLDDLKPMQLGTAIGDQPSVSDDGKMVVYVKSGGIHIYYIDTAMVEQITQGGIVQDGQPRFINQDKGLVFTRYADDTNHDGKLDADDHATLWTMDLITQKAADTNLEHFGITPLTNASFAAFSPQIRGDLLIFTRQSELGLNIFHLPKEGQLSSFSTLSSAIDLFDSSTDYHEKTLIFRKVCSNLIKDGKPAEAAEASLLLLQWLVRNNRVVEATILFDKIGINFPTQTETLGMSAIAMVELELLPWVFPKVNRLPDLDGMKALSGLMDKLGAIKVNEALPSNSKNRISGYRGLLKAKILASMRKFFDADKLLAATLTTFPDQVTLGAEIEIFSGLVANELIGRDTAIQRLKRVIEKYPKQRTLIREASHAIVAIVSESKSAMEDLAYLRVANSKLPMLPAIAHLRIAENFQAEGKGIVAANELRQMLLSYPRSPEIVLSAAERLIELMEASGRVDELEGLMFDMHEQFQKENPSFASKSRSILISLLLRKGGALMRKGDLDGATTSYLTVTAMDPNNIAANRGIIDAAYRLENLDAMKADFEDDADDEPISAERLYIWGYAKSYEIDKAKGPSDRIKIIDACIKIVEEARELNGQSVHIHQTLGWLYYQKGFWLQKYQQTGTMLAKTKRSWNIFTGFFGWPEADWLELAIDSYSAAYFLSDENSVEKANIAQNLGNTYYQSKNYPKALSYYMTRVKMLARIPVSEPRAEAALLAQAGRSAFHADEYELAGSLQSQALESWEKLNDEQMVGYSLDVLALTLIQMENYTAANKHYQRLLRIHVRRKDLENTVTACINLGYSYYKLNAHEQSLTYLKLAERGLKKEDILKELIDPDEKDVAATEKILVDASEQEKGIEIALGGKSAAKGFDTTGKFVLIHAVQSQIYQDIGRLDLAMEAQNNKIRQLEVDRKAGMEKDQPEAYLAEELAIAKNHLGALFIRASDHEQARKSYEEALSYATRLRPEKQTWMIQDEWTNLINIGRVNLRLAQMGAIEKAPLEQAIKSIDTEVTRLREAWIKENKGDGAGLIRLVSILGLLKTYSPTKDLPNPDDPGLEKKLEESFAIIAAEKLDSKDRNAAMVAWQGSVGDFRISEKSNELRPQFRKDMLNNKRLAWKLQSSVGDWQESFDRFSKLISAGGKISSPTDLHLFRQSFEKIMDGGVANPYGFLRKYHAIYQLNSARLNFKNEPLSKVIKKPLSDKEETVKLDPYKAWIKIESDETVSKSLGQSTGILAIHRTLSGKVWAFLQFNGTVKAVTKQVSQAEAKSVGSYQSILSELGLDSGQLKSLYIVPSHELFEIEWGAANTGNGKSVAEQMNIAFLPQVDLLPKISAFTKFANHYVGSMRSGAEGEKSLTISNYDVREIQWKKTNELLEKVNNFQVIHSASELVIDESNPVNSVWKIPSLELQRSTPQEVLINQVAKEKLNHLSAIVFANTTRKRDPIHVNSGGSDGWAALTYAALAAGVPTLVISEASKVNEEKWSKFYSAYEKKPLGDAIREASLPVKILGSLGHNLSTDEEAVDELLENLVEKAEQFEEVKKYREAALVYLDINSLQIQTSRNKEAVESLLKIRTAFFKAGDFESALHFQLMLAENEKAGDPEAYAEKSVEAAGLATRAEKFELADELFKRSEAYFTEEEDNKNLANIWRNRAVGLDMQKKYQESVNAFAKARDLFIAESDKKAAAQMLLDQGNIFALKLNDFPKALEKYQGASEEFVAIGDKEAYYLIQIDRANAFNKIGRTSETIALLTKILKLIDKDKSLIPWVRTSQGLANGYYLAGQSSTAAVENAETLNAIEDIQDEVKQINQQIEGSNLKAMIYAKLGKFTQAFTEFDESLASARKYKLKAKQSLILNNYGYWSREAGKAKESIAQLEEALEIDTDLKLSKDIAFDQRNLAISIIVLGDFNRAADLLQSSLKISQKLGIAYNTIYCMFGLAEIGLRSEKYEDAKKYLGEIRDMALKNQQSDFVWKSLAGLAKIAVLEKNQDEAKGLYANAISYLERRRAGLKTDSSVTHLLSEIGVGEVYDEYIDLLAVAGGEAMAWQLSEHAKSRAFLDTIASQNIKFADDSIGVLIEKQNVILDDIYLLEIQLSQLVPGDKEIPLRQAALKKRTSELQQFGDQARTANPHMWEFATVSDINEAELIRSIPRESLLVEYKMTRNRLLIWTFDGGGRKNFVVNVSREKLASDTSDMQQLVSNFSTTSFVGSELYKFLVDPIGGEISKAKELILIPDDFLIHLSFAALEKDGKYLIEQLPVTYLESARSGISLWKKASRSLDSKNTKILAIGNPIVPEKPDLAFAKKEVDVIKRYYPHVKTLTGAAATKDALTEAKDHFDIVHLASHSSFDAISPLESIFHLSSMNGSGNISVADLFGLGIRADLVVLSACESSITGLSAGREIIGLNRALAVGGARSVLSSLWRISDVTSAVVMKRLYRYLAEGSGKAGSLRLSQLDAMKNFRHPAYWASFRLVGQ
jgi:CHAT domain-containing protein/tetratricopeptide (TPR) repeat protein